MSFLVLLTTTTEKTKTKSAKLTGCREFLSGYFNTVWNHSRDCARKESHFISIFITERYESWITYQLLGETPVYAFKQAVIVSLLLNIYFRKKNINVFIFCVLHFLYFFHFFNKFFKFICQNNVLNVVYIIFFTRT